MSHHSDIALAAAAAAAACFDEIDVSDDDDSSNDDIKEEKSIIDFCSSSSVSSIDSFDEEEVAENNKENGKKAYGGGDVVFSCEDALYGRGEEIDVVLSVYEGLIYNGNDDDGDEKEEQRRRMSESVFICGEEGVGRSALLHTLRDLFLQQQQEQKNECLVLSGHFVPSSENNNNDSDENNFYWDSYTLEQEYQWQKQQPCIFQFPSRSCLQRVREYRDKYSKLPTNLILLMDDLQYADPASMQHITQLLSSTCSIQDKKEVEVIDECNTLLSTIPILFIASYRQDKHDNRNSPQQDNCHNNDAKNESIIDTTTPIIPTSTAHNNDKNSSTLPSLILTKQLQSLNLSYKTLTLPNLSRDTIHSLISDFLSIHTTIPFHFLNLSQQQQQQQQQQLSVLIKTCQTTKIIQFPQQKSSSPFQNLSKSIYQYTRGNPKQIYVFLNHLIEEQMLTYIITPPNNYRHYNHNSPSTDAENGKWIWDSNQIQYLVTQRIISDIQNMATTNTNHDEVEEVYTMKKLLIIASFLGMEFDLDLLRMAYFYDRCNKKKDATPPNDENDSNVDEISQQRLKEYNLKAAPSSPTRKAHMLNDDDDDDDCSSLNKTKKMLNHLALHFTIKAKTAITDTKVLEEKSHTDETYVMNPIPVQGGEERLQKQKKRRVRIRPRHAKSDSIIQGNLTEEDGVNPISVQGGERSQQQKKQKQRKPRVRIRPRYAKSEPTITQGNNNYDDDCCSRISTANREKIVNLSQHDITATTATTASSSTTTPLEIMTTATSTNTNTPKQQQQQQAYFPNIIQKQEEESKQEIDDDDNDGLKGLINSLGGNPKKDTREAKLGKLINRAVDEGILEMIRISPSRISQDSFNLKNKVDNNIDNDRKVVRSESMSSVKAQQSSLDFHLALQPTSLLQNFFPDLGGATTTASPRTSINEDTPPPPCRRPHPPHTRPKLQRRPSILPPIIYKFTDAQIQKEAYSSLVPKEEDKNDVHARIGGSLLSHGKAEHKLERSAVLFTMVDQFNRGALSSLSSSSKSLSSSSSSSCCGTEYDFEKKTMLADLNLRAARRATEKLSFKHATTYVDAGISLIDCDNSCDNDRGGGGGQEKEETRECQQQWKQNYNLCLELYTRCASLAYYNGDFTKVERINDQSITTHVKCPIDALRSRVALINSLNARTKYKQALEVGFTFLSQLGYNKIPQKSSSVRRVTLVSAMFQSKVLLGKSKDSVLQLPRMVPGTKYAAAMEAFNALLVPAYIERRDIALLIALKMVRLTLRRGICGLSAVAFAAYGKGLAYTLGDFDGACRYGQLALSIIEKMDAQYLLPRVQWMVYGYIHHWKNHIQMSLDALFVGYQTGMDYGATECAFLSAQEYCILYFYAGLPLDPICQDMKMFVEQIVRLKQDFVKTTFLLMWQAILNLMRHQPWENEEDRVCLTGDAMDEQVLKDTIDHNHTTSIMYHCKMWLAYYFGDYEFAAKMMELAKGYEKQTNGHFAVCKHHFFVGLISVAMARKAIAAGGTPSKWKVRAKKEIKRLERWAEDKAVNCLHLLFLLQAEYASLEEEGDKVQKAYDNAISTASRHGFYQDKALAYERAGVYFVEQGDADRAKHYILSAHEAYTCWGAQAKADHLRSNFSVFLRRRRMSTGMCSIRGRSRFSIDGSILPTSLRDTKSV